QKGKHKKHHPICQVEKEIDWQATRSSDKRRAGMRRLYDLAKAYQSFLISSIINPTNQTKPVESVTRAENPEKKK
ncbi:MAG: hypothetical protein LUF92_11715, partial [Clostridiales bacterium]|nr:hypothetical protein [Clostridiales bacterium]